MLKVNNLTGFGAFTVPPAGGGPTLVIEDDFDASPVSGTRDLIDTGWSVSAGLAQHNGGVNYEEYWFLYSDNVGIDPYISMKITNVDNVKSSGFAMRCQGSDSVANMGAHYDCRVDSGTSLVFAYFSAGSTLGENVASTTLTTAPGDGDYIGIRVTGTGTGGTTFEYWDFGTSENTDPSTWGAATESLDWGVGETPDSGSVIDTGNFVGMRCYTFNKATSRTIQNDDFKVWTPWQFFIANSIAEISTQLAAAAPGDEVHVVPATAMNGVEYAPGLYMYDQGPTLDGIHKADYVSIRGSDPNVQTAWRGRTSLKDASYIRLEGLRMSHHNTDQSDVLVTHNGSHHIQIYNCDIRDGDSGAEFFSTSFLEVVGNRFGGHMGDCMKFGAVTDFIVENNSDDGTRQNVDPTSHLDFIQGQAACSRGVIRGNVFLGHNVSGKVIQGLFFSDAIYSDLLIELNLIYTNAVNGIRIGDPENTPSNIDVVRNTCLSSSGSNTNITINGGSGTVDFNIGNSGAGPNGHTIAPGDYSSIYQSVSGPMATIQDFTPVPGSAGETLGAAARINQLLTGEPTEPPVEPPEPPMADYLTITNVTPDVPAAGTYSIVGTPGQPGHHVEFTPALDYSGPAGYTYTAVDTDGQTTTAHVEQEVSASAVPLAVDDVFPPVPRNSGTVVHDVLGNDDPGA